MYLQHPLCPAVMARCLCVSELWHQRQRGELKISTRDKADGVPMYSAGNSITSCTDSGLLSAHSAVVVAPRQCWPQCVTAECHRVLSPRASHYYWLPPLTCRVDIHLLKVLMEGWGTPILRPEQKDSLSLHVMVAHVWQTWPTFPPFLSHNSLSLF